MPTIQLLKILELGVRKEKCDMCAIYVIWLRDMASTDQKMNCNSFFTKGS